MGKMVGFRAWVIAEMTRNIAADLQQWMGDNDLPFNDLFPKGETRVIIPFFVNPQAQSILDKLKQSGMKWNFKDGTVAQGNRVMRLGKYILNKKSPFTEQEKWWWNHSGNAIKELEEVARKDDYVIIISRSPIDIVRMSDHDGWTSCHNPRREYFKCAISDAKGAGAIAYVVKKEDLKDLKNLQAAEVFADPERHIDGIKPISRIRLRKFVNKKEGDFDLAVPEDRVYGVQIPGVDESVRKWVLEKQMPKIKKYGNERPRLKDFNLVGGSYQDTLGGDLFNYLFGDDLDDGDADYGGEDEDHQNMADQMQDEVDIIERTFRNKYKICSYYASVEDYDDNHPYVSYGGTVHLSIPEAMMLPQKKEAEGIQWNKTAKYRNQEAIKEWAENNVIGETGSINEVEIDGNEVRINIYDDNGNDPDALREFLNSMYSIEKASVDLQRSLYMLFVQLGLAKESRAAYLSNNFDDHPHQFTHFVWEEDESELKIELKKPIELGGGYPESGMVKVLENGLKEELKKQLVIWADRIVASQTQQKHLFGEPEIRKPFSGEFKVDPEIYFTNKRKMNGFNVKMAINLHPLLRDEHVDDALAFVAFLDKNYERFERLVLSIWAKINQRA